MIAEYLKCLGYSILNQIEKVSIDEVNAALGAFIRENVDLWKPYKTVIEELIPNTQVVADRFHVMTQINKELDDRRKQEKRQAEKLTNKKEKEAKLAGIKNSKYPLLKKKENLNETEKEKLKDIEKVAPELIAAYQAKDKLREIFDSQITSDEAF